MGDEISEKRESNYFHLATIETNPLPLKPDHLKFQESTPSYILQHEEKDAC